MTLSFQALVKDYLARGDKATTTTEKGKALEDLVSCLFERVPGISVTERNTLNYFNTEEIDVAFWNEKASDGLYFLPYTILVECKNWANPVSSIEVAWFDRKIEDRGLDFGILFASNGITGDDSEKTRAHLLITQSLARKRDLIIITRADLTSLTSPADLVQLIKRKLTQLKVGMTLFA